jgi:hypothetical protein
METPLFCTPDFTGHKTRKKSSRILGSIQQNHHPLRVEDNTKRFKPNGVMGFKDNGPFLLFGDGCAVARPRVQSKLILVGSKETPEPSVYGLNGVFTR